jgi:hypothetical protein
VKVTRIAYSRDLTAGKYGRLVEQARRLGRVRSLVWDRYGSITGVGLSDRQIRDLVDTDGEHHGPELGELLRRRCDTLKGRNARRAKVRPIANRAAQRGRHGKAEWIRRNNLGTLKKHRQQRRWEQQVATVTYRAVNAVVDNAGVIVAEDLSGTFTGRNTRGANTNRRWAAWTTGVTAEALTNVSGRRGSAVRLVNAASTSQVIPGTGFLGKRVGDRLCCPHPGRVVWHADHAAAINLLDRAADADIGLCTPHRRVKQIIQDRADRPRSRLPDQDSNTTGHCRCGERNIQSRSTPIKE